MEQTKPIFTLSRNKTIEITGEGYFEGLANNNYWMSNNNYWAADYDYSLFVCSVCEGIAIKPYKTCPHCESEMTYIVQKEEGVEESHDY
ncbi:MAG: hypothetical protein E7167_01355 [Firmicutes bacterium]|nr:hypothetical protein [Bacillota bacterium]